MASNSPEIERHLLTIYPELAEMPEALSYIISLVDHFNHRIWNGSELKIIAGHHHTFDSPSRIHKPNGSLSSDLEEMAGTKKGSDNLRLEIRIISGATRHEISQIIPITFTLGISFETNPFSALPINHITGPFGITFKNGTISPTADSETITDHLRKMHKQLHLS